MFVSITLIPERPKSVPSLIWIDINFLTLRPRFNPRPVHVEFLMDKVTFGQVVLQELHGFPFGIIPQYVIENNHFISLSYQLTVSLK
jgi:hypothetical protein